MSFQPNDPMMDLFRAEVESHSQSLTTALLALEKDPTATTAIDGMMRAAHSIKGAARIVRVEPAVAVAHVMEDCFVAAQHGKLSLKPDDIDVLLRGVDLLVQVSAASKAAEVDLAAFDEPVRGLVVELKAVLEGRPAAVVAPSAAASTVEKPAVTAGPAVIACPPLLDAAAAEVVRGQLLTAVDGGPGAIGLDLSATIDLDAIGLAFLSAACDFVADSGRGMLELSPVSPVMLDVLRVTGLIDPSRGAAG